MGYAEQRLRRLIASEPSLAERIEIEALNAVGLRLYNLRFGDTRIGGAEQIREVLAAVVADAPKTKFSLAFLISEWLEIVDAWQIRTWEGYRDVRRLGRKMRLSEALRKTLWELFEQVNARLAANNIVTYAGVFTALADSLSASKSLPFDVVVVDEAQDVTVAQLRFLSVIGKSGQNALFFAGDLGQRIFQTPFSWKSLGVDIRGRSKTLTVNYRTSHQIRQHADKLLEPEVADVDGNFESRKGTVSVFSGPAPVIAKAQDRAAETKLVGDWLKQHIENGVALHEFCLIVRSELEIARAIAAAQSVSVPYQIISDDALAPHGSVGIATMHIAKGHEFRAVAVMACDADVIPSQQRIAEITDEADLEEVYATERHLLYVAITRARDFLLITSAGEASEFLDDLK